MLICRNTEGVHGQRKVGKHVRERLGTSDIKWGLRGCVRYDKRKSLLVGLQKSKGFDVESFLARCHNVGNVAVEKVVYS